MLRILVIVLRTSTPMCVFFFDTGIWYTLCSSICSTLLLARHRRLGRITSWRALLSRFMETVDLHGSRLVARGADRQQKLSTRQEALARDITTLSVPSRQSARTVPALV